MNHHDVQTHKSGIFGFGEKHVPCPRCEEDHKVKLKVDEEDRIRKFKVEVDDRHRKDEEHQLMMEKQRFEFEKMKLSAGVGGGASPSALAVSFDRIALNYLFTFPL